MALQDSITYLNDLDLAIQHTVGIEQLKGTTILVTGATGTIGSFVADMLLRYNQTNNACITVCVAGRNLEKMHKRYESWKDNNLKIFKYDVLKAIIFDYEVDYVIHAAGMRIHLHLIVILLEQL